MNTIPIIVYKTKKQRYYLHKVDADTQRCWWTKDINNTVVDHLSKDPAYDDWTYYDWEFWLNHIVGALIAQGRFTNKQIDVQGK